MEQHSQEVGWAYFCKAHLSKQAHPGFRALHLQHTGERIKRAPPTDRSSNHRCRFSTLQVLRVKLVQLSSCYTVQLPCLKALCALASVLGRRWDQDRFALAVPWIFSNTILKSFHQTSIQIQALLLRSCVTTGRCLGCLCLRFLIYKKGRVTMPTS